MLSDTSHDQLLYTYIRKCHFVSLPGGQILNVNALNHWPMPSYYVSVGVGVGAACLIGQHLIGQNDRAVCKRHDLSWRCVREAQSALRLRAGPARH